MSSCKYNSYDNFPAKVFFEIRETGNYQLMCPKPKTSVDWLKRVFVQVYDDYFIKSDNKEAVRYLELLELVSSIEVRIAAFLAVLNFHWETPKEIWHNPAIVEIRNRHLSALNNYLEIPIDLDGDFDTEIQKTLNVSIGIMKNELAVANIEIDTLRSTANKTVFEFYDALQNINECNMQSLPSTLLLPEYVAAEKSAIKKSERARLKNNAA